MDGAQAVAEVLGLLQALLDDSEAACLSEQDAPIRAREHEILRVSAIAEHLRRHFAEPLTLPGVAAELGMSVSTLNSLLKRACMHHASDMAQLVSGIIALLLIAALVLVLAQRLRLPFTILLVLTGMGLAKPAQNWPETFHTLGSLHLSPDLIFYVFLPTLIFESALNLDVRQLRRNLGAVLLLAGPGLLLSTFLIGGMVALFTDVPIAAALLLGAILSATDPVAVIALFKQLGAPQRLTILVEGESLFNDATAVVVAKVILAVVMTKAFSATVLADGILTFFILFGGGLVVGLALGFLAGLILGRILADPLIEISLSTILAYLSFLLAETVLHVSGIMATLGAGIVLGGWGRMKVSASVRAYLDSFWEYMAFIANALIFLLVGMQLGMSALRDVAGLLLLVVIAMLISRAAVVYGLMPLGGRLRGEGPVSRPYQTIMFWGGLRGAIALAIVMSLPGFPLRDVFIPVVMGAVLFTLLAQGLTIRPLMHRLDLDRPPLTDRLAQLEVRLEAQRAASSRVKALLKGGLFSSAVATRLEMKAMLEVDWLQDTIAQLRRSELDHDQERRLLYVRSFAEEKSCYVSMLNEGHLSESAFRELALIVDLQIDNVRYQGAYQPVRRHALQSFRWRQWLFRVVDALPGMGPVAERIREARVARDYEEAWGRCHANSRVLAYLKELERLESIPADIMDEVSGHYQRWHEAARQELDQMAEQFPEFVNAMQERLAKRLRLLAEAEAVEEQETRGTLPHGTAHNLQADIVRRLAVLRGQEVGRLRIDPTDLLRTVPFFKGLPEDEFSRIAEHLERRTVAAGETLIRQGEPGRSFFLIARGVVRVTHKEDSQERDLATLIAGDFFGEMALLGERPRTATIRAVTPCSLYEVSRDHLSVVMQHHPQIRAALEAADQERQAKLDTQSPTTPS